MIDRQWQVKEFDDISEMLDEVTHRSNRDIPAVAKYALHGSETDASPSPFDDLFITVTIAIKRLKTIYKATENLGKTTETVGEGVETRAVWKYDPGQVKADTRDLCALYGFAPSEGIWTIEQCMKLDKGHEDTQEHFWSKQ